MTYIFYKKFWTGVPLLWLDLPIFEEKNQFISLAHLLLKQYVAKTITGEVRINLIEFYTDYYEFVFCAEPTQTINTWLSVQNYLAQHGQKCKLKKLNLKLNFISPVLVLALYCLDKRCIIKIIFFFYIGELYFVFLTNISDWTNKFPNFPNITLLKGL